MSFSFSDHTCSLRVNKEIKGILIEINALLYDKSIMASYKYFKTVVWFFLIPYPSEAIISNFLIFPS